MRECKAQQSREMTFPVWSVEGAGVAYIWSVSSVMRAVVSWSWIKGLFLYKIQ